MSRIPESALYYQEELRRAHSEKEEAFKALQQATFAFDAASNHAESMRIRMMRSLVESGCKPKTAFRIVYES